MFDLKERPPGLGDFVGLTEASPPQLVAPVSRSLRQRWQKLGARLVADHHAAPRWTFLEANWKVGGSKMF